MSNFTKGQTVTLNAPKTKKPVSGVLAKYTAKSLKIVFDGDDGLRSISSGKGFTPEAIISGLTVRPHEGTPISDQLQGWIDDLNGKGPSFSKGDIVSYEHKGKTCTGRIIKGGSKPQVAFDMQTAFNIPTRQLTPAEMPNPDPELAEWDVIKMTDDGMGRGFPMFTATIARNGKKVFQARCLGDGGVLRYEPFTASGQKDINDWKEAIKAYMESKGEKDGVADELWPDYAWEMRPTGMTFVDYVRNLGKMY